MMMKVGPICHSILLCKAVFMIIFIKMVVSWDKSLQKLLLISLCH